jgi:hypothetical protein
VTRATPRRGGRAAPVVPLLRAAASAAALAAALGGCYTFAPAAAGAVPSGARVRVALTESGAAALSPTVGSSVTAIEGDLLRVVGGDTVVVRADRLSTTAGVDVQWSGGDLNIPGPWRQGVDRRRLARGRTAGLVAGGVAVSAGLFALIRHNGGGQGGGGGGDPITVYRGRP